MQTWASVEHGYWYARSAEFLQHRLMQTAPLAAGARRHDLRRRRVAFVWFVFGLSTGHSYKKEPAAAGLLPGAQPAVSPTRA